MREKNFELANKLETERKMQPGRVLGMQPWQVAIWFLEPQLEKDHDVLKCQFDAVQDENDTILSYNRKLQAEYVEEARRPYVSRFVLEQLRLNHLKPTGADGV